MKIPEFNYVGNLPPGIHWTSFPLFIERFGFNSHRLELLDGMKKVIHNLSAAGCNTFFVDGSFTTIKEFPNDYDACWEITGVNPMKVDPILLKFDKAHRSLQRYRYRGDIFPAQLMESSSGMQFLNFFQVDKSTGDTKGLIAFEI